MEEINELRKTICSDLAMIKVANSNMLNNNNDLKLKIITDENIKNRYEMLNILDANNEKLNRINKLITSLLDDERKIDVEQIREILKRVCGGVIDELL